MKKWTLNSWNKFPAKHIPDYSDQKELDLVLSKIKKYPPLVFAGETRSLKKSLAQVVEGKAFLLQGGDCAESFAEFNPDNIKDTFKAILQMSLVLTHSASLPVVKLGRIAGQFSKPRSSPTEKKDGKELPSYLGDNINGMEFSEKSRKPDPKRLFRAYSQSASTLNLIRAFSQGGFADLRQVHLWNLGFINEKTKGKYKEIEDKISDALSFMDACGINPETNRRLRTVNFYTSHEALLLPFEEAMTRVDSTTGEYHDTSAHFVWVGDRTRQPDGAHIEFCRGIKNPIGLKCGPTLKPDQLIELCNILNPENEPGRLTLISRFGADNVDKFLPKLIRAIKKEGMKVIWSCDPMHGNTIKAATGFKTRPFDNVLKEVKNVFATHQAEGSYAGGLHVEMTGQDVTECTGGAQKISEQDLSNRYRTHCDPRLNASQALELAFLISEEIKKNSKYSKNIIQAAS
ncbi:MAG: 3-deoxy-7-phosphoheptulonate synthase class II [Pelagibacteraceae bacterium TMED287]|nr:MAG: 3-deoxy-7-phosphoheptulonate synthase class II [Pelagibacteraceae bacterium TMED287]|tara:strand:- start:381 stop:1757 length:1377 start_codon:yes stop_codon:yes gene_type:complete